MKIKYTFDQTHLTAARDNNHVKCAIVLGNVEPGSDVLNVYSKLVRYLKPRDCTANGTIITILEEFWSVDTLKHAFMPYEDMLCLAAKNERYLEELIYHVESFSAPELDMPRTIMTINDDLLLQNVLERLRTGELQAHENALGYACDDEELQWPAPANKDVESRRDFYLGWEAACAYFFDVFSKFAPVEAKKRHRDW